MEPITAPTRHLPRWLSPIFFLFLLYLIFFLPFWQPLLLAFLFSCAGAPVVNYLNRRFHSSRKVTSAVFLGGSILLILLLLTVGGIRVYGLIYEQIENPEQFTAKLSSVQSVKAQLIQWLEHLPFVGKTDVERQLNQVLVNLGDRTQTFVAAAAKAFVLKTPEILLNLFIFIAALGVFLFWGPKKWFFISRFTSRGQNEDMSSFTQFERICAISIGSIFLTGLIQASIVSIGAGFSGYPIFLSFLFAFIFSMIPVLGAALVPLFLALLSYANGSPTAALVLAVTAVIAGTSDNIVRAWLFSRAADSNPVISLLALLGGITLFGFPGLFMAPVVEQLVMSYLQKSRPQTEKKSSFAMPLPTSAGQPQPSM